MVFLDFGLMDRMDFGLMESCAAGVQQVLKKDWLDLTHTFQADPVIPGSPLMVGRWLKNRLKTWTVHMFVGMIMTPDRLFVGKLSHQVKDWKSHRLAQGLVRVGFSYASSDRKYL